MSRTPEEVASYVEGYLHGARSLKGTIGIELNDLEHPVVAAAWERFLNKTKMIQVGAVKEPEATELREQIERYR